MSTIKKIWGIRQRLLSSDQVEVDFLILDKDTACSIHSHKDKINRFVLVAGDVDIKSDLGTHKLIINQSFDVEPPTTHQFVVRKKSYMIELAFVKEGKIRADDICRMVQGGKIINDKFITLDRLREDGALDL